MTVGELKEKVQNMGDWVEVVVPDTTGFYRLAVVEYTYLFRDVLTNRLKESKAFKTEDCLIVR